MAIIDGVKNLLFDLGGVLMDIKRENCVAAFEAIGVKTANQMLGEYSQKGNIPAIRRRQPISIRIS